MDKPIMILLSSILLFGCIGTGADGGAMMETPGTSANGAMEDVVPDNTMYNGSMNETLDERMNESTEDRMEGDSMMISAYYGEVLAGTTTPYVRFNLADYNKARENGKAIYLYFYADWCPICRAERPNILDAFNRLDQPNAVGFEVHFKDGQSNQDDASMAKQFGVVYQHTTVILRPDGSESFRSLEPIGTEQIISEVGKAV